MICVLLVTACGARRLVRQGETYMETRQYAAAERTFRRVITRNPRSPEAHARLAEVLLVRDRPEQALHSARKALDAGHPRGTHLVVRSLLAAGEVRSGHERIERWLREHPRDPHMLALRARVRLARGDTAGAVDALEQAIRIQPDPEWKAWRAWMLARGGDLEGAQKALARLSLTTHSPEAVLADAAAVYLLAGNEERRREAVLLLRSLSGIDPGQYQSRAVRRDRAGDRESAIRFLAWSVACDPRRADPLRKLGELFLERGSPALAIEFLRRSLEAPPDSLDVDQDLVDPPPARLVPHITRPDHVAATLELLSRALADAGRRERAAHVLQAAFQVGERRDPQARIRLAQAWIEADRMDLAVHEARSILADHPRFVEAHLVMVRSYAAQGEVDLAIGHGRLAWKAEPGHPAVARLLGQLYEYRGDLAAAREIYAEAWSLHPDDAELRILLERVQGVQGSGATSSPSPP